MEGVDKSRCHGPGDTPQRLGGVEKTHDQIFLPDVCLVGDHVLEHGNADGVSGIHQNTEGDEQPDARSDHGSQRRSGTHSGQAHHGTLCIGPVQDPDTECHIGEEGNKSDCGLDDPIVG